MEIVFIIIALVAGAGIGYMVRRSLAQSRMAGAEREADRLVKDAQREAETTLKEARVEAKEELHRVRTEVENELRDRRAEVAKAEERSIQREEQLAARVIELDRRDQALGGREAENAELAEELHAAQAEQVAALERISGLTTAQATELLMKRAEEDVRHDMAKMVRAVEEEAKREADRRARNVLSLSIQRTAANHVAETTVSVVALPSDDMKGRIIGREGRNIRALENVTGIDFIIDDTPEAVVLSGFDGVRREIARLTLSKLLTDGRIHPARIEEMYTQAKAEVEAVMEEAGEQACFDTNVHGVAPELVRVLGRLKFRTSYGQNVLNHSIEVAHLAGIMAASWAPTSRSPRRAGLLHDIGKAVDHEVDGSHAQISAQLARKYRESRASARDRGPPPGRRAADRRGGSRASRRRHLRRRAPERAARRSEDYVKRPRVARAARRKQERRREVLRHAGRARGPRHGQAGRGRRRPDGAAGARDSQGDRGATRVPGPDQGHRDPREPRHRVREVSHEDILSAVVRLSDERSRRGAHPRPAGGRRLGAGVTRLDEADVIVYNTCTVRQQRRRPLSPATWAMRRGLKRADPRAHRRRGRLFAAGRARGRFLSQAPLRRRRRWGRSTCATDRGAARSTSDGRQRASGFFDDGEVMSR